MFLRPNGKAPVARAGFLMRAVNGHYLHSLATLCEVEDVLGPLTGKKGPQVIKKKKKNSLHARQCVVEPQK